LRTTELLSRLVLAQEMTPRDPLLRDEYFKGFEDEWDFLKDFHRQFGSLPNRATFLAQFPDFDFVDTEKSAFWLADEVAQDFIDTQIAAELAKIDATREENPREAIIKFTETGRKLAAYLGGGVQNNGDLWHGQDEIDSLTERRKAAGLTGITLGFDLLDDVCKGTQPGEIEVYFARPGIGKSFILLWGSLAASRDGVKVAFVSPEMDRFEVGARFQSFVSHVSALELFSGTLDDDEMEEFTKRALNPPDRGEPILFYQPSIIGRQFTTADIAQIIRTENPGLVCIDGLMLIDPIQSDKDIRKRIINTMSELKDIAVETGVPIRLAHQANRSSEGGRRNSLTVDDLLPSLHHMAESGAVEQYANRAVALARTAGQMLMAVRKNRNGPSGRFISVRHDIDRGRFTEAMLIYGDQEIDTVAQAAMHAEQERAFAENPAINF
jgi:hypothetical protein